MNSKIIYVDFTKHRFKRKFAAFIKHFFRSGKNTFHPSKKKTYTISKTSSKKRIIPY